MFEQVFETRGKSLSSVSFRRRRPSQLEQLCRRRQSHFFCFPLLVQNVIGKVMTKAGLISPRNFVV